MFAAGLLVLIAVAASTFTSAAVAASKKCLSLTFYK